MGNIFAAAIFIAGLMGWVMNIIAIAGSDHVSGMVLVRVMGVLIAPLGAILGWF